MSMLKPSGPLTPIGDDFGCKPSDIDTTRHFWHAFDNNKAECVARRIVRTCQEVGNKWLSYGKDKDSGELGDIEAWLIEDDEGFQISREFVGRCLAASPAKPVEKSNAAPL